MTHDKYKCCSGCREWLEATSDNFYKSPTGKYGLHNYCKTCQIDAGEKAIRKHRAQKKQAKRFEKLAEKIRAMGVGA